MRELTAKSPTERVPLSFDFSGEIATGDSIVSQTLSVRAIRGIDLEPALLLSGAPERSGTIVQQLVQGGMLGELYEVSCTVETVFNAILQLVAIQPVRDPADT